MNSRLLSLHLKKDVYTSIRIIKRLRFIIVFLLSVFTFSQSSNAQKTVTFGTASTAGAFTWKAPAGVTTLTSLELWGAGGAGGGSTGSRGGGGGGGGAYKKVTSLSVTTDTTYDATVGTGGAGSAGNNGGAGTSSTFVVGSSTYTANSGSGGTFGTNSNSGTAGSRGSAGTGDAANYRGGSSADGSSSNGGGGGGSAGTGSNGNAASSGTGGAAVTGGGAGGNGTATTTGGAGGFPGGGGGGSERVSGTNGTGGAGANGKIVLTFTCPTYSLTSTSSLNTCINTAATVNVTGSAANLPLGTYTVTYNLTGTNTATGSTATMTVSTTGSGSFTTSSLANTGSTTVTITNLLSGSNAANGCSSVITSNNTATFSVSSTNTASAASSSPSVCINSAITNIKHTTANATGIGIATGLPAGVSATWSSNTITISGTPTASGTFNYSIPLTGGCGSVNATGTITVAALPNAATAGNQTKTYTGVANTTAISATAGVGETIDWYADASGGSALTTSSTSYIPVAVNAGTYTYYAAARNTTTGCVSATRTAVTLTINKVTLTVTADNKSKVYDGVVFAAFTSTITGFVNNETATVVSGSVTYSGTATSNVNAGSYVITPVLSALTATNYSFTSVNGTLTISKAATTISVNNSPVTYTGSAQAATINGSVAGTVSNIKYNTSATIPTNAGTYAVTADFTVTDATNYNSLTTASAGNFIINKATPVVTVTAGTYTYNGNPQGPSAASNTGTGTSYTYSYAGTGGTTYSASSTAPTNAGSYTVTVTVAASADGNYNAASSSATAFTINKATPVLTVTNSPVTYNGNARTAVVSGSVAGTITNIKYNGSLTEPANAGTYAVRADFTATDATNYNNVTAASAGNFIISTKALTITANNQVKCAGSSFTFAGTEFISSGLITGDAVSAVVFNSTGASSSAAAGSYAVTASGATGTGLTNYNISYIDGTLTVNANPTISLGYIDDVSKAATSFSIPYTSLTGSPDQFSLTTGATALSGFSAITNGSLTASPLVITIPASNTGVYNFNLSVRNSVTGCVSDNYVFDLHVTGLYYGAIGSDQTICAGSTAATLTNQVSATGTGTLSYTWEKSTTSLNAGFEVIPGATESTYSPGVLNSTTYFKRFVSNGLETADTDPVTITVNPLPTAPVAGNQTKTYTGVANATAITATPGTGETIDWYTSATGGSAFANATTSYTPVAINAGTYTFYAEARNTTTGCISASRTAVTLTIDKAVLTVTADDKTKLYDRTAYSPFTVQFTGFVNAETIAVVTGTTTFSGTAVSAVAAGTHIITPVVTDLSASNYTFTAVNGSLLITKVNLTISGLTGSNKTYDGNTTATATGTAALSGKVGSDDVTISGTASYSFATAIVGTNKTITTTSYTLSGTDAGNYTLTQPTLSADITAKGLTITGLTGSNKTYDGNRTASATGTATLNGIVGSDNVSVSGIASYSFATAIVGTAKVITTTGYTLTGADAGNYTLTQPTLSADITAKGLTITGLTGSNKTYDGNTTASATGTATLNGIVGSDNVSVSGTASYSFATATVGTAKSIATTGYTLSGTDAGNYSLTQPTLSADITAKGLTITGLTGSNKQYDGNTTATSTGTAILSGTVGSDDVTISGTASYSFATATVGTNKTITTTGYTLSGTDAGNYSLTQPTLSADITAKGLTITGLTGSNKTYDGNTTATATGTAALSGKVGSDDVTISGTASYSFATATVGTNKTITTTGYTLSGTDAGNYTLTQPTLSADITAKGLTITGLTGSNKTYDGNTTASATGTASVSGKVGSDDVTISGTASYSFATATVGTNKTITTIGYTLSGTDAGNYSLTQPTLSADITAKGLTITGLTGSNKTYDGNTTASATGTATLTGIVGANVVTVSGTASYSFATATVGTAKAITTTGYTLSGADAGNYTLTQPTLSADITAKGLTITGLTGSNKQYDGNTAASATGTATLNGVVGSDAVSVSGTASYSFATATIGTTKAITTTGYTLSGADAGNYTLTQPTLSADITAKGLTITGLTGSNKQYDGNTAASATGTATLNGVVGSDAVSVSGTASYSFATATIGTAKAITTTGYTLSGADAGNYTLTQPSLSADITAKGLTITGLIGSNKTYDGNTTASATGTESVSGKVGSDDVTISGTASYSFATATVGTAKPITTTGYTLSGADAGNYTLTQPTLSADITAKGLTITGLTGSNKTYDGNTTASATGTATLNGIVGSDVVSVSGTAAYSFATATVGTAKSIATTGYTLSGADAGNYTVTQPTLTANITAKGLTITGLTGSNKQYDGNTTASATGTATLTGIVGSDVVTVSGTASYSFATATVGTAKSITTTGYTLSGADAGNYTLTQPSLTANITKNNVTVSLTGTVTKVYDGTTTATLTTANYQLTGIVAGETVVVTNTAGEYNNANAGTGKPVTVTSLVLGGADAGNYQLTNATSVTGSIGIITSNTTPGDFRSKASGLFDNISTWQYNDGTGWVDATSVPGNNNVTISSAHTITQNIDFTVATGKTFSMESSAVLIINTDKTFTVQGTADFNGQSVILKSTVTGSGSIGTVTGTVTGATNVTIERFVKNNGRKWRMINTPLKGSSNNSIWMNWQNNGVSSSTDGVELFGPSTLANGYVPYTGSGLYNIYQLNASGSDWEVIPNTKTAGTLFDANGPKSFLMFVTSPYKGGAGNISTGSSATTLKATGELIVGNYTTSPLTNGQFQLVPNPYASAIDFNSITKNNIANTFWVWDPSLSGFGGYVAFLNGVNSVTGGTFNGANQTQIQSGESFFVQAAADGATITFKESDKVNSNGFVPFGTTGTATTELIRTKLYKPALSATVPLDGTASVFTENGSVAVTSIDDATDLTNWGEDIAIIRNSEQLAIEQRPLLTAKDTIFLRLSNLQTGSYQLEVEPTGFDWTSNVEAFVVDKYLATRTPVSVNTISKIDFSVNTNSTSTGDRFMLVFQPVTAPLPVSFTTVKANAENTSNKIEWSTGVESNLDRFDLEWSKDGRNFTLLTTLAAKNKDNSSYSWLHLQPQGELQYYRIKAIEASAAVKYSSVVSVRRGLLTQRIVITPNPVTGNVIQLQLQNMQAGKYTVRMYNTQGLMMTAFELPHQGGNSSHTLNLPALPAGVYEVRIENNKGHKEHQRIVVMH